LDRISSFCRSFKDDVDKLSIDVKGGACFNDSQRDLRIFSLVMSLVLFDHLNKDNNNIFRLAFIVPSSITVFSINPFFAIFKMSDHWINSEGNDIKTITLPFYLDAIYLVLTRINSEISILSKTAIWKRKLYFNQLKTAIISILIDSYAHNISAHSLAALKWWIELRAKILDKRFKINDGVELNCLHPCNILINKEKSDCNSDSLLQIKSDNIIATTLKYYSALGLTDSTYNEEYYSILDLILFSAREIEKNLLRFSNPVSQKDGTHFNPRFPVPIDYALYPFFRFLRDKGAFWSGVTRDTADGGESKTWFKILWEDFANNPLYLGTIARTEGINKLHINLAVKYNNEWINGRFLTIDLSLIDYEEKIVKDSELNFQYSINDNAKIKDYLKNVDDQKLQYYYSKLFNRQENNNICAIREIFTIIFDELMRIDIYKYMSREDVKVRFENYLRQCTDITLSGDQLLKIFDEIITDIYFSQNVHDVKPCIVEETADHPLREKCDDSKGNDIDLKNYSKYAMIKLGKCFQHFRELLDNDEFEAFLPGGLVGEHALFTIFENTIRNIKHYKESIEDIKKNGLDFWIAINQESLGKPSPGTEVNNSKSTELFKIHTWLGHKTPLFEFEENQKRNEILWQKVTDKTLLNILDENGTPRMGGNSQDKACAAMLFNNTFISAESNDGDRDTAYYPWVNFTTLNYNAAFNLDQKLPRDVNKYCRLTEQNEKEKFIQEYSNAIAKDGYLLRSFYLWRSADCIVIDNKSDLEWENISRFKFVLISEKLSIEVKEELIEEARGSGIIRLLFDNDDHGKIAKLSQIVRDGASTKNEKVKELYIQWLNKWLSNNDTNKAVNFIKDSVNRSVRLAGDRLISETQKVEGGLDVYLSHGGGDEQTCCNVRSHGSFWNKFFSETVNKDPNELKGENDRLPYDINKDYLLLDLLEVLATKVVIFDDRINARMPSRGQDKRHKVFEKQLLLYVSAEEKNKASEKHGFFKGKLENLCNNPHVLIVHLSYIEALKYSEDNINKFIEEEIKELFDKENFIFVVTTGRGRGTWRANLDGKYKIKTVFKPIESLLNAVENGISYNDNFDVKYNLIKAIFGS